MIAEMRMASLAGKLIGMDNEAAKARDVFNAATLECEKALGRDDLGRLAPGAKADIVLVNFDNVAIGPGLGPNPQLGNVCVGQRRPHRGPGWRQDCR